MLEHFFIAVAAHITADVSKEGFKKAFDYIARVKPELAKAASDAEKIGDIKAIDDILQESLGIINFAAASGNLKIDGAVLTAINSIRFDHQNGKVKIAGTTLSSQILVTGGSSTSTGRTTLGSNTNLKSQGTEIKIGNGASIVMTGGASIKQT